LYTVFWVWFLKKVLHSILSIGLLGSELTEKVTTLRNTSQTKVCIQAKKINFKPSLSEGHGSPGENNFKSLAIPGAMQL